MRSKPTTELQMLMQAEGLSPVSSLNLGVRSLNSLKRCAYRFHHSSETGCSPLNENWLSEVKPELLKLAKKASSMVLYMRCALSSGHTNLPRLQTAALQWIAGISSEHLHQSTISDYEDDVIICIWLGFIVEVEWTPGISLKCISHAYFLNNTRLLVRMSL